MKASELKVTVKLIDVLNSGHWRTMCDKYGINEWCINEGLADDNSTTEISLEDAESYGMIERE